jgi:protocatechuate 3,4-dioxygenase beta subunit
MYRPLLSLFVLLFALFLTVGSVRPVPSASLTTGDLAGTVKDTNDKVVANAVVRIAGGPELRTARTDSRGKYLMADLLPGTYDLFAQKPGYAPRHKGSVVVEANDTTTQDFKLEWATPQAGAVEVTVVDSGRRALPDASVDLTQVGALIGRSTTDEVGTLVFAGLTPGIFRLAVTRPGFRAASSGNLRVRAGAVTASTVTLKRDTSQVGRLGGTVRNLSGATVANAKVDIIAGLSDAEVRTTGAGRYELSGLIPGTGYSIQVSAVGYATQTLGNLTVNSQQLTNVDVTLLPNAPTQGSLTGTVTGPAGDPVPFATVSITAGPELGLQTLSGADGRYTFTQLEPSPDYGLLAQATGYSTAGRGSVRITAGATTVVDLRLTSQTAPPGVLAGTVREPSGRLLANVVVTLLIGPSAGLTTTTDGSGEYRIEGIRPDSAYTVRFSKTAYTPTTEALVQITSGFTTALNVELRPLVVEIGHITGTVRNADGGVVKNAKVSLTAGPSSPVETVTAADGTYSLRNLRPGSNYTIRVEKASFVAQNRKNVSVSNGQTTRADFTLDRIAEVGTLSGRVTDLLGRGIGNALVAVLEGPTPLPEPVRADATGRFVFESLPSGRYTLEAVANGYANGRKTGVLVSAGGSTVVTIQLLRP